MATYSAADLLLKARHLGQFGEVNLPEGKVVPSSAVVTGDTLRVARIPAGTEVHALLVANASMGGPAPADFGYTPVDANEGSLAANLTYFASAVALGTASNGTLLANFDPIKFEQDVYLVATFGAVTAGTTGTTRAKALSRNVGVR